MNLINLIRDLIDSAKTLDTNLLPTKGYFYPKDFSIKIKKAKDEDIIEYEYKYDSDDILEIVECIKRIVKNNTVFSNNYEFGHLKSVDIIFIFLEIVSHTTKKTIKIEFFNDESSKVDTIDFGPQTFKYYDFNLHSKNYNEDIRAFDIDGYKFSMPSVGVENSLSQYLLSKSLTENSEIYNELSYDFLFFVGHKSSLTFNEIENLITIFNDDIDESEKEKIKSVIRLFIDMIGYRLKFKTHLIDVKTNLNLEKIWKI